MSNHREAYNISMGRYQSQILDAETAYRKADLMGDEMGMSDAHMELAALQVQANQAHQLAVRHANSMQAQPQGNKYGLSPEQAEIARKSYTAPGMTDDQKDETYARNVQKLARMKASGEYDGTQGKVFK